MTPAFVPAGTLGAVVGGTAGASAAFNEAGNNAALAAPLIFTGLVAGRVALVACARSPACVGVIGAATLNALGVKVPDASDAAAGTQGTGAKPADTYGTPPNGAGGPPPDDEAKNPNNDRRLNQDGEMLGRDGTQTPSTSVYSRQGVRIDVENPNPGQRPGQVHLQIGSDKYYFNPNTMLFENADLANIQPIPRSINNLISDPAIQRALNTGLRYLREAPIKF